MPDCLTKTRRLFGVSFPVLLLFFWIFSCKPQTQSQVATFRAGEFKVQANTRTPMLSIVEDNSGTKICRLSGSAQIEIENGIRSDSPITRNLRPFGESSSQSFSSRTQAELKRLVPEDVELCTPEWEQWFLRSAISGRPAPVDIASAVVPGLVEIKMGVAALGLLAGRCGRPIEATALGVCSIALSYAQDKGLIRAAD
jgi:hypothetical protein